MTFPSKIGSAGSPVRRVLWSSRWILPGAFSFALALFVLGCPAKIQTSVPPCPHWDRDTIADYERLLQFEDSGVVNPKLDRLHEYLERQVTFCIALDAAVGREPNL